MIKPVTFQGQFNFNANLYALEIKSRFIDQNNAHGYYTGYGDELAATIVGGNKIQIGTGAFVVCGRMSEVTAAEIVQPQIFDGFKGYVLARIETFHPADEGNTTIIAKVQTSWEALNRELEQNDVYASTADNVNTAYELPIYSFEINGTQITNLVKLIKPVCDYATIKTIVDNALATAQSAVSTANGAVSTANAANAKSDNEHRKRKIGRGGRNGKSSRNGRGGGSFHRKRIKRANRIRKSNGGGCSINGEHGKSGGG